MDGLGVVDALEALERHAVDLARLKAKTQQVIEEVVVQLVRAHQILGLLRNLAVARGRQKLGRYRRIEDVEQDLGNTPAKDISRIAHQVTHERLGHARVDGVHAHVVAVIGSPAERQLRQVARADDKAASLVGQIHQNLRTLAGLAVLVGHVLHGLIVLNVLKVLLHGRVDRNLAEAHAQVAGKRLGIGLGAMRRAKTWHGDRRDTRARQPQCIEGANCHEQCQRGVQATRKADDRSLGTRMGKAGLEPAVCRLRIVSQRSARSPWSAGTKGARGKTR